MLKDSDDYHYIFTEGLRTCVAFALINPTDNSALLIHFYHPHQIANDLGLMVSNFLQNTLKNDEGIICLIAGGRSFYELSEQMCDQLILFVKEELINATKPLKLIMKAPIVADNDETLSVQIDLRTGQVVTAISTITLASEDKPTPIEHIEFTDLLSPPQSTPF